MAKKLKVGGRSAARKSGFNALSMCNVGLDYVWLLLFGFDQQRRKEDMKDSPTQLDALSVMKIGSNAG